jgi:hypothetical protein
MNENKNNPTIPEERLKELNILKVVQVIIGEEETLYRVITNDGEIKIINEEELQ